MSFALCKIVNNNDVTQTFLSFKRPPASNGAPERAHELNHRRCSRCRNCGRGRAPSLVETHGGGLGVNFAPPRGQYPHGHSLFLVTKSRRRGCPRRRVEPSFGRGIFAALSRALVALSSGVSPLLPSLSGVLPPAATVSPHSFLLAPDFQRAVHPLLLLQTSCQLLLSCRRSTAHQFDVFNSLVSFLFPSTRSAGPSGKATRRSFIPTNPNISNPTVLSSRLTFFEALFVSLCHLSFNAQASTQPRPLNHHRRLPLRRPFSDTASFSRFNGSSLACLRRAKPLAILLRWAFIFARPTA